MWVLSCTGDLLGGKRSWLRPGSIHLLGRTSGRGDGEQIRFIDHKSVSRKHLIIRVDSTTERDLTNLGTRTRLELVDGSKSGTSINGEKIKQETRILTEKRCVIKLGSYEQEFILEWIPVVVTNSTISKPARKSEQLVKFSGSDVKIVAECLANVTTHLVAKKRNTPTVLQALLNAQWTVTEAWTDDLCAAMALGVNPADGEITRSRLELDFDAHWPKEIDYLIPASTEPVLREDHHLVPRPERSDLLRDFTFVFLSQSQYDSLLPVVTSGGGKSMIWSAAQHDHKVDGLLRLISSIVGKEGVSPPKLSQYAEQGGVVIVRLNDKDEQVVKDFLRDVDLALEQRSIEQSEFLDAILMLDASKLRRSLLEEGESGELEAPWKGVDSRKGFGAAADTADDLQANQTRSAQTGPQDKTSSNSAPNAPQASTLLKRKNRHVITQSRFKGFDDIDSNDFKRPPSSSPERQDARPDQRAESPDVMDVDSPTRNTRSYRLSVQRQEDALIPQTSSAVNYDSLLQGQAALKQRRLRDTKSSAHGRNTSEPAEEYPSKKVKRQRDVDVAAQLQAHRAREEEERRKKEEANRDELGGLDVSQLRDLAIIEKMDVIDRPSRNTRSISSRNEDERWDPAWNGRKNFKKFRRKGDNQNVPRLPRVIVALEEVPRRGHGIGDEYWLSSSAVAAATAARSENSGNPVESDPHSTRRQQPLPAPTISHRSSVPDLSNSLPEQDEGDLLSFQSRVRHSRQTDVEIVQDSYVLPQDSSSRRATRDSDPRAPSSSEPAGETSSFLAPTPTTLANDTQRGTTSNTAGSTRGKRAAAQQGGPAAKRTRGISQKTPVVIDDDEDDDDALKFRRRQR